MNPLISVIIPAYNAEQFLERCLDSVLAQDYKEIELVIVNDGSTDGTREILARYAKLPNVTCIEQDNAGPARAGQVGFQASRGEFISFVGADDYIAPNMLSSLYGRLKEVGADVASCGWYRVVGDESSPRMPEIDGTSSVTGIEAVERVILREKRFSLCTNLYKRSLCQSIDFDEICSFRMGEDAWILFRLLLKAEKVVFLDEALYFYMYNPQSITSTPSLSTLRDHFQSYGEIFQSCLAQPHEVWKPSLDDFYFYVLKSTLRISTRVRPSSKEEERELRMFQDEIKRKILSFPLERMTKEQRAKARACRHVFLIKLGLFEKVYTLWSKMSPSFRSIIKK